MSCASNQFTALPFYGPHEKPHCKQGLSKNDNFRLEPRLGNGKCAIIWTPFACNACTDMLDESWAIKTTPLTG